MDLNSPIRINIGSECQRGKRMFARFIKELCDYMNNIYTVWTEINQTTYQFKIKIGLYWETLAEAENFSCNSIGVCNNFYHW